MQILILLTVAGSALAAIQQVWWNITYVQDTNPDGLFPRRAIGVNGTWPPPPIELSTNDSLVVHAINSLTEPATLHHHGMFFNSTSWYDGTADVTQCGIPPGQSLDYHVPIDMSGQWGTYWVHAHSRGQYVDGLRAPLILHPPTELYTYDDEFTVIMSDWYHQEHSVLLKQFINIRNPGGAEPIPDAALMYFSANGSYLPPIVGRTGAGVGFNENASLPFEPGKTYRLRVINVSAFAAFFFWIDGHNMTIIEADGTDTEQKPIDVLSLTAAQRYSILVKARNDTSANWMIHAAMDTDMFDVVPPTLNPNASSVITYSASSPLSPPSDVPTFHITPDISFTPVPAVPPLPPATLTVTLDAQFETRADGTNRAFLNTTSFVQARVPALFSALSLGNDISVTEAYVPGTYVLNDGAVVDLVLRNADAGKHPFHLHGHKFQLISRTTNYATNASTIGPGNPQNPMRRDTVQVPSGDAVTMRFVADNPGVWLFHCHIEWHLQAGLAVQFVEAPSSLRSSSGPPQTFFDQCAMLGQPTTGNAAGRTGADITDLKGLDLGPGPLVWGWTPKGIGAVTACVLSAVIGMATVVWYSTGSWVSEAEAEREARERLERREQRGAWWALWNKKNATD